YLSCCAGIWLQASEVKVSPYDEAEWLARCDAREPTRDQRIYYYFHEAEEPAFKAMSPYHALANLNSDDGCLAFEDGLRAWFERDANGAWCAAMMMHTLSQQNVMGVSRLLSATRWLEEIPGAESRNAIPVSHAKALGKLLGRAAEGLGYKGV